MTRAKDTEQKRCEKCGRAIPGSKRQHNWEEWQAMRDQGKTLREIGELYGVNPAYVCRVLSVQKKKSQEGEASD